MSAIMSKHTVTTIDLLRHGECEGGEIYRGHVDVALSEQGWQSMQRSIDSLEDPHWQRIVSSPLQRCARFAETVAEGYQVPLELDDAFKEVSFGDWDGKPSKQVWQQHRDQVLQFFTEPETCAPPNGESLLQLQQRLVPAFEQLVERCQGEHILLVQHGGTIRALLGWLLNMPLKSVLQFDVPYASLSRIRVFTDHDSQRPPFPSLVFFNRGCAIEPVTPHD